MTQTRKSKPTTLFTTRSIATMGVLAALASALFFLEIPIVPGMYNLDFSNLPVMLGAFSMGPVPGLIILLVKNLVHLVIKGLGTTGGVGNLADFIMGAVFMLPAALLYRRSKNLKSVETGMIIGIVLVTVVSVFVNKWIMFPFFTVVKGYPMAAIIGLVTKVFPFADTEWKVLILVTAPFNLVKAILIMAITRLIYKPLSPVLKGTQGR